MNAQIRNVAIILVVLVVAVPAIVAASNFFAGSFIFDITIDNPITCDPPADGESPIAFTLFPGESQNFEIVCSNSSETNLDAMFIAHKTPDNDDVRVDLPDVFLIPGKDSTRQLIVFRANRSADLTGSEPFRVVLELEAGEYP